MEDELKCTWHFSPQGLSRSRSPGLRVRSYRTFSPLSRLRRDGIVFCDTICPRRDGAHPLDGAVPYAVRTFLPLFRARQAGHKCDGKTTGKEIKFLWRSEVSPIFGFKSELNLNQVIYNILFIKYYLYVRI